jgi:hypothetical protein
MILLSLLPEYLGLPVFNLIHLFLFFSSSLFFGILFYILLFEEPLDHFPQESSDFYKLLLSIQDLKNLILTVFSIVLFDEGAASCRSLVRHSQ